MTRHLRLGLAVALLAGVAAAARGPKPLSLAELPAWVREAAVREIEPAGRTDLVWLHDEIEVAPQVGGGVRVVTRVAARVLQADAMRRLGRWSAAYRRGDEVESIRVWSVLPDGTARAVDPKDGITDVAAVEGYSVYDDNRARIAATPPAPVGSVVAFESSVLQRFDPGAAGMFLSDPERATALARFTLRVPAAWSWKVVPVRTEGISVEVEDRADGQAWTARHLAPLRDEPYRPAASHLSPLVWARWASPDASRGFASWDDVARWERELSEPVLSDRGGATAIAAAMQPQSEPDGFLAALARGFDHAARGIRYVSIQLGIGGYKPRSPAETESVAYGDCKAKTFLLRSLVQQWGATSYPVLVRTDDLGPVVAEVPTPAQFNHMIAAVALPDGQGADLWTAMPVEGLGRIVFLDPTAALGGAWDLPSAVQGTTALLIHPGGGMLVKLPVRPPSRAAIRRELVGRIDDRGTLVEARIRETWVGAQAAAVRGYWSGRGLEDRRRQVARDVQRRFPGAEVREFDVRGLDDPAADIRETTSLAGARIGTTAAGGLLIVEPGALAEGLFGQALPPPPRHHRLDLGLPREESVETRLEIPDGWVPEELPPPFVLEAEMLGASATWSFDAGQLVYRRTARLIEGSLEAARYAEVRRVAMQLGGADRAAIVFVRRD